MKNYKRLLSEIVGSHHMDMTSPCVQFSIFVPCFLVFPEECKKVKVDSLGNFVFPIFLP